MDLTIIKYCAEECERQRSGELSVYNMCNAWEWAQEKWDYCPNCANQYKKDNPEFPHDRGHIKIDLSFIEHLGKLVEPEQNPKGFRTIPIYVSDGFVSIEKAPWERIPDLLTRLIDSYYADALNPQTLKNIAQDREWWTDYKKYKKAKTAEDIFYYEYEQIHPFRDGNGRTGKILYNYLSGTLDNPIMPPNFWGSSNP